MKGTLIYTIAAAVFAVFQSTAAAQGEGKNVKLHVNPRWKQCSFQLDPSLTQDAWHQFTAEAGLVSYFRPLTDAKPMGGGNFEVSILNWQTKINDTEPAWNDTFVHPDSTHWLIEGDKLAVPGLMFRAGISDRMDVGAYWTKAFGANYGFWGAQVQYAFVNDLEKKWAASARLSFVSIYGPDDLNFATYGLDFLASREYSLLSDWVSISPYAGVSAYLANSHETTAAVDLSDEHVVGVQGTVGAVTQISIARLAVEYSVARVNSLSFKLGVTF